jgi:hypothetical protein
MRIFSGLGAGIDRPLSSSRCNEDEGFMLAAKQYNLD